MTIYSVSVMLIQAQVRNTQQRMSRACLHPHMHRHMLHMHHHMVVWPTNESSLPCMARSHAYSFLTVQDLQSHFSLMTHSPELSVLGLSSERELASLPRHL